MNTPFFGEQIATPEVVEGIDNPSVVSDPFAPVPVPADVAVTDVPLADEIVPVVDVPIYQAPVTREGPVPSPAALLNHEESEQFRTRWNEIQAKFIDEPRDAVQQADALVSDVVTQLTQMFAKEHNTLESQWKQGNDVSTEDLRKALQHYRAFFNRLVV